MRALNAWANRVRWAAVLIALALTSLATRARAQASEVADAGGYQPKFRRFGVYDYLGTGVLTGAYYLVELTQDGPRGADWTSPLPLDRPLRDAVAAETLSQREAADRWSDYFWYGSVAYPVLDALIAPSVRTRRFEVSWNMSMMNFQSFMLISLLVRMPHKWLGRLRPDAIGCAKDPNYNDHCGNEGLYVSFPGGHVGVSMTGAGLSCAHHIHGRLYGSRLADGIACGAALTAGATVGYFRMRADKHWLSDQLAGTLLGLFSGYVMPTVLYYHPFWASEPAVATGRRRSPVAGSQPRARMALLPWVNTSTLGAALMIVD